MSRTSSSLASPAHPAPPVAPAPSTHPATPRSVIPAHAGISSRGLLTSFDAVLRSCLPGRGDRLIALDAAIRAPLPLSTRVGVLGATPDAPTAMVGGLLTAVLAARRPHRVLAASAHDAEPSIGWFAGITGPATSDETAIARRATARTGAEATDGLAQATGGGWAIDLAGRADRWWDAVAPISRFFDFVVTDWGSPMGLNDVRAAGGVLLVVAEATRESLRAGVELKARLEGADAPVLLAVLDRGDAPRGLAEVARVNGASWLPGGRGLDKLDQRGQGLDKLDQRGREQGLDKLDQRKRRLGYATTTAVLELAARVVAAAAPVPATPTRTEASR